MTDLTGAVAELDALIASETIRERAVALTRVRIAVASAAEDDER